jgi:phage gpG-like protein
MRFTIDSDFSFKGIFNNPQVLMQRIGTMLARNIIARTQFENVDPEGKPFEKYSDKYRDYKNRKGGSGNIVNLKSVEKVSEHMVASTDIVSIGIKGDSVEIGVTGQNLKKAMYNENMKDRVFLGISDDDSKEMDKIIDDYVGEELKKL